jgi:hypothetical protein
MSEGNASEIFDVNAFLRSEGVQELIKLTNTQFAFWGSALADTTSDPIDAGNLMDFWFVMSALATSPAFKMPKKDAYETIPRLKPDTVRKYAASAQKLGFVETINSTHLRLTENGAHALARTLMRWIKEFREIDRKHFSADV